MADFMPHTDETLIKHYQTKSYQGQTPELANIFFLSKDANWPAMLSECWDNEQEVHDYLEDGIKYCNKNWYDNSKEIRIHHPLLSKDFIGDKRTRGVPYHRHFKKIGFSLKDMERICFIELLGIPTIGMSSTNNKLYNEMVLSSENHSNLNMVLNIVFNKHNSVVFVCTEVYQLLRKIIKNRSKDILNNFADFPTNSYQFKVLYKNPNSTFLVSIRHLSASNRNDYYPKIIDAIDYIDREQNSLCKGSLLKL